MVFRAKNYPIDRLRFIKIWTGQWSCISINSSSIYRGMSESAACMLKPPCETGPGHFSVCIPCGVTTPSRVSAARWALATTRTTSCSGTDPSPSCSTRCESTDHARLCAIHCGYTLPSVAEIQNQLLQLLGSGFRIMWRFKVKIIRL